MGKSFDFPAVTIFGLDQTTTAHVLYETPVTAPEILSSSDAAGSVTPTLNQQSPAPPAYRRSLFRQ